MRHIGDFVLKSGVLTQTPGHKPLPPSLPILSQVPETRVHWDVTQDECEKGSEAWGAEEPLVVQVVFSLSVMGKSKLEK